MQVQLSLKNEFGDDPEIIQEKNNRLILKIHKEFPEAVWEKSSDGFTIFI